MVMTDPIADMLTRIRNANKMRHEVVAIPYSKVKAEVLEVLKQEGFINSYVVEKVDGHKKVKIDIEFVAVGLISIPDEKELLSLMDEIRNEKSA